MDTRITATDITLALKISGKARESERNILREMAVMKSWCDLLCIIWSDMWRKILYISFVQVMNQFCNFEIGGILYVVLQ